VDLKAYTWRAVQMMGLFILLLLTLVFVDQCGL
jgi:hypothetical protein